MDFQLPDENTMELMRKEFAELNGSSIAHTLCTSPHTAPPASPPPDICLHNAHYITGMLLILYFIKVMSYNIGYGTQIYDSDGGLEKLQSVKYAFGKLNNLF